ncbi:MAG: hypothetical protein R3E89_04090 [Thiolinea sp.]
MFGDTRPVHQQALPWLRSQGIRVHVFEEGYLRPHWLTLETNGVTAIPPYSTRHRILATAGLCIWNVKPRTLANFGMRSHTHHMGHRLANAAMKPWYPHYQTHRPANALWEYLGWGKRMPVTKLWHTPRKTALIRKLVTDKIPYYPFPLQLDADAQIRVHSPYDDVEHAIRTVMQSFARHAPADSHLVIKNHPLAGIINHRQQVKH